MIETVILIPLYMILIFGLIFFGYSTLAKQQEAAAGSYTIAQGGRQSAADVMPLFFPWNPKPAANLILWSDGSSATAGDAMLRVHDVTNIADVYAPAWHTAPPVDNVGDTFDSSRVAEYLWILGLPTYEQHFEWVNGVFKEVIVTHHNYRSLYLDSNGVVSDPALPPNQTKYTRGTA